MIQHSQSSIFTRIRFLIGIQFVILAVVLLRLFFLQVIYWNHYKILAEDNRTRIRPQFANRGEMLDRWGVPLVTNIRSYDAYIVPDIIPDIPKMVKAVSGILNLSPWAQEEVLKNIKKRPKFFPTLLKEDISWEELSKLELYNTELPGVYAQEGHARNYLLKHEASQIVGYISTPNQQDVQKDKILISPGAKIGKNGLEYQYESSLRGVSGQKIIEVNSRGRSIRELSTIPSQSGQPLKLTIDYDLQKFTGDLLAPYKSSAAVVLDIKTGEILTMVSTPGYDPSAFFHGISRDKWNTLINDPLSPMTNKAISGLYSPGSSFKILIALAALKAGINPKDKVYCPGHMMLGKHKFHCWRWKQNGHGYVDMERALYESCDVYFYETALKIKEKPMLEMAKLFGIKEKTGIDLPAERAGFIADPEWKKRVKKEAWYPGDTILTSIGQGYVLMSPLQLVTMIAMVANGGHRIRPHLAMEAAEAPSEDTLNISPEHLEFVMNALGKAVNDPHGTAYGSRIKIPEFEMGGKTSTAQVRHITMAERQAGLRSDSQIPWHLRDTSIFVAFAPTHAPRYASIVIGEHEGWGSGFAASKTRDILLKTQELMTEKEKRAQTIDAGDAHVL
ncbi:MAG: penicillin-binding protein 2 [Alphaproteobacteria bacterium]